MPTLATRSASPTTRLRTAARGLTERHANADLSRATRDGIRHDAVDPDHGQPEGKRAKRRHERRAEPLRAERLCDPVRSSPPGRSSRSWDRRDEARRAPR